MNIEALLNDSIAENLSQRFCNYVKQHTTSSQQNADNGVQPSTERQRLFAQNLQAELAKIGISDCYISEHSYLCARLPATQGFENAPSICFLAHLDTVEEVSGENVQPQLHPNYDLKPIILNGDLSIDPKNDLCLAKLAGDTIITSDGSTLLGADDKAGVAEIVTALETLQKNAQSHGQIEVIFSPDEETGHGMDNVPLDWIQSEICYTLDGGEAGEIEMECFNAYKAEISFFGQAKHTGTARPDMVNALTMAANFVCMLPRHQAPETTDKRQGFFAPMEISGSIENAKLVIYLRDFDRAGMQKRIQTVEQIARTIEATFEGGKCMATISCQYLNMKEKIEKNPAVTEKLVQAVKMCGMEPVFMPIRGGTDGSRLTELGLPCPNIFTGGHNFHSRKEWASLSQMVLATRTVLNLIELYKTES